MHCFRNSSTTNLKKITTFLKQSDISSWIAASDHHGHDAIEWAHQSSAPKTAATSPVPNLQPNSEVSHQFEKAHRSCASQSTRFSVSCLQESIFSAGKPETSHKTCSRKRARLWVPSLPKSIRISGRCSPPRSTGSWRPAGGELPTLRQNFGIARVSSGPR